MRLRIAVLVTLVLLAAGCRKTSVEVDPALAAMVPADTVALTSVRLDALRAAPLYQKWIAPRVAEYGKENGVDLNTASELLAVSNGKDVAVFAKGKSSVFRLNSKEPLPRAKGGVPKALQDKIRTIPPQNQIWTAGIGTGALLSEALPRSGNLANLRNVVTGLESYTVGMDMSSTLKMQANFVYASEADAKRVHDGLRGLVALGKMSVPKESPELLRFFDGIQISQQQAVLTLMTDVPAHSVTKFMERVQPGKEN